MSADHGTPGDFEAIMADLRSVQARGGRALASAPRLLVALGLPPDINPEAAWPTVEQRLKSYAAGLEPRLREAFIEGMGLRRAAPREISQRLQLIAERQDRSPRTARRRVEEAIESVARLLLSGDAKPAVPTPDWLMVRAIVRADLRWDQPSVVMNRTIQALVPVVDRFEDKVSIPVLGPGESITVTALEGCATDVEPVGSGTFRIVSRLNRPVAYGEEFTFAISIQVPRHDAMAPMVGFYPVNPTREIVASVTFGARRPASVSRFEGHVPVGTFPPVTEDLDPTLRRHECTFRDVQVGFGYGIKWAWA